MTYKACDLSFFFRTVQGKIKGKVEHTLVAGFLLIKTCAEVSEEHVYIKSWELENPSFLSFSMSIYNTRMQQKARNTVETVFISYLSHGFMNSRGDVKILNKLISRLK